MDAPPPIDTLHAAVQAFSNTLTDDAGDAGIVTNSLVVWEEASYSDDGSVVRGVYYAATGDSATPSASLGLAVNLLRTLEQDIIPCKCGSE